MCIFVHTYVCLLQKNGVVTAKHGGACRTMHVVGVHRSGRIAHGVDGLPWPHITINRRPNEALQESRAKSDISLVRG